MSDEIAGQILANPAESPRTDAAPQLSEPVNDDFSQRMSHLTKKEAELERRKQELSRKEQSIQDIEGAHTKWNQRKERIASGDMKEAIEALQDLGISYEKLTEHYLANEDPQVTKYKELQKEIESIKQAREAEKEEYRKNQLKVAEVSYKNSILAEAAKDPDKFEMVLAMKDAPGSTSSIELAFSVIKRNYEQQGEKGIPVEKRTPLSAAAALELVEAYLTRQEEQRLLDLKKRKKLSAHFGADQKQPGDNTFLSPNRGQPTTLGGDGGASGAVPGMPMTHEERHKAALKAFLKA